MAPKQETFWPMPPEKLTAGQYKRRAEKLYAACWRKEMPDRGIQYAVRLLRSGRISYEDLMQRVKAQTAIFTKKGTAMDYRPLFSSWINGGAWQNEELAGSDDPKIRLKAMFEKWVKDLSGWHHNQFPCDYHERRYVWLHLRKLDRQIPKDLHVEAGRQYEWSVRQFGSIYAGEAPRDVLAAIEELKDA